jgi:hypothetical protein
MLNTINQGVEEIQKVLEIPPPPDIEPKAAHVIFEVRVGDNIFNGEDTMAVQMRNDQHLSMKVQFTDKVGQPAQVEGAPVWDVSDASFGSVRASDDGMSAAFSPAGPAGACQINCTADADLGEGVRNIIGTLDVTISGGEAVMVAIEAEVVEKTPRPRR